MSLLLFGLLLASAGLLPARQAPVQARLDPFSLLCPALPAPSGTIVDVDSVETLENAVNTASPGTTIRIANGYYNLNGVYLRIDTPNLTLRSASGNREDVVLDGNYLTTEIIQIVESDVTIADLTLREAYYHPIHVTSSASADTVNTLIYNVHIIDPGEQAIKINPNGEGYFPDDGEIACSKIELTDSGRTQIRNNCYTGGIDAHQARDWQVRDNWIEGFWCDEGFSEHAIHFWRGSRGTLVERNTMLDNARGVGFGLVTSGTARTYADNACPIAKGNYVDHYDGLVKNNFVAAARQALFDSDFGFDCGICLWQACEAQVFHNTVASTQAPFSSIEWRFDYSEVEIRSNLVSHNLRDRGGAATLSDNLTDQSLTSFIDVASADLRLLPTALAAIDQAPILAGISVDIEGFSRPVGSAPDIGADEYGVPWSGLDHNLYLPIIR